MMEAAHDQTEHVDEVIAGLRDPIKHLPCKLLYDAKGAELFEAITEVDDYYLTRAEHALLRARLPEVAIHVGTAARVIEPGSGAGKKTQMLLSALDRPASYVAIDVAEDQLADTASTLSRLYPGLEVTPVLGDYTQPLVIPAASVPIGTTVVFVPGSTIGNFEPDAARCFLKKMRAHARPNAMLLLGADGNANKEELLRAYDDSEGVTAAFDLNVLAHVNVTHRADFDLERFMHRAVWNASRSRIEMHLVSKQRQTVHVGRELIKFERGEPIVTEHCYKHSPAMLASILRDAGWALEETFVDAQQRMRLYLARGV